MCSTSNQEERDAECLIRAGIVGATGNTGVELVNLLTAHPQAEVVFGTSRGRKGQRLSDMDPSTTDLILQHPDDVVDAKVDVVFLCLPHGASAPAAEEWSRRGPRVIDLSGDLRLTDSDLHTSIYKTPRSESLMGKVVYGLPEINRKAIADAMVVSNPGCYATASALSLLPLAEKGLINGPVVIDAKSGVSGAGRSATATTHYCSANEDIRPYKVGRAHRHVPEIEQILTDAHDNNPVTIVFIPQLVPLERGILTTAVVHTPGESGEAIHALYTNRYADDPFVRVLPLGEIARIRGAAHTNRAVISVTPIPDQEMVLLTCAIDNLLKGAAGQAVENMNLMFGLPEAAGLRGSP